MTDINTDHLTDTKMNISKAEFIEALKNLRTDVESSSSKFISESTAAKKAYKYTLMIDRIIDDLEKSDLESIPLKNLVRCCVDRGYLEPISYLDPLRR